MPRGRLLLGATLVYLLAAWLVAPGFYDGFAPSRPYNWISPPPGLARGNRPPQSATRTVAVSEAVSSGVQVQTADQQAWVVIPAGGLQPEPGTASITVRVEPVAVYPRPHGLDLETNVYLVSANARLVKPMSIALSFSSQVPAPSTVYEAGTGNATWKPLPTQANFLYQLRASSIDLGYFVGALPHRRPAAQGGTTLSGRALPLLVAGLILLVLLAALPYAVTRRRRSDASDGT